MKKSTSNKQIRPRHREESVDEGDLWMSGHDRHLLDRYMHTLKVKDEHPPLKKLRREHDERKSARHSRVH